MRISFTLRPFKLLPHIQRIRHSVILVCFGILQLFQSVLQPLQFLIGKVPSLDDSNDRFHHILTNIVGQIHVIEIGIAFIFHKVISEALKHFEQDGNGIGIIALAERIIDRFPVRASRRAMVRQSSSRLPGLNTASISAFSGVNSMSVRGFSAIR